MMNASSVALVNMEKFINGTKEERRHVACEFGQALKEVGFVAIYNCGINFEVVDKAYACSRRFFKELNESQRNKYLAKGNQGYVPFNVEHSIYSQIPDLKTFYHFCGYNQSDSLIPTELPEFKSIMMALHKELVQCIQHCLQATALYLGYEEEEETILADMLCGGVIRLLYYPALDVKNIPENSYRSAPHEDVSAMTIIPKPTASGLRILTRSGEWVDIDFPGDIAIINAGDTLKLLTNGIIPSTTHCVINPQDTSERFSIPMFSDFKPDTPLKILNKCATYNDNSIAEKIITYQEFLYNRLKSVGY